MRAGLILAIDQGTTNTKALLMNRGGEAVFRCTAPVGLIHPRAGFVEQDPELLWLSVVAVMGECVAFVAREGAAIEAVAISNQRETAVAWDAESGAALANAVGWQCGRSAGICARLAGRAARVEAAAVAGVDCRDANSCGPGICSGAAAQQRERRRARQEQRRERFHRQDCG